MPIWVKVILICSPWIFGVLIAVIVTVISFRNRNTEKDYYKLLLDYVDNFVFRLHWIPLIPVLIVLWPISQGFALGLLFIYLFFCPNKAAVL